MFLYHCSFWCFCIIVDLLIEPKTLQIRRGCSSSGRSTALKKRSSSPSLRPSLALHLQRQVSSTIMCSGYYKIVFLFNENVWHLDGFRQELSYISYYILYPRPLKMN